ncbi:Bodo-specific multi-copy gene family, putative, partial [Bodo saltans]
MSYLSRQELDSQHLTNKGMFHSIALFNKGMVSKWFHHKGFGFIVEEGTNKSYFVHRQGLNVPKGAVRALSIGQEVEFEIAKDDDDSEKAVGVTSVGGGTPRAPRPPQRQFDDRRPRQQGGGFDRGGRGGANNGQRHDNQKAKRVPDYDDPNTWPKDLTEDDTRAILRGKVSENTPVDYLLLTALRRANMFDRLSQKLRRIIKQPPSVHVNAEEYLSEYLINKRFPCSMALQDRAEASKHLTELLDKVHEASNKRCIISCFSPRGSGKTQFVKYYFFKFHEEAIKHGRVIVRCCDKAESGGERWIKLVMEGKYKRTPLDHATAGLCELIRSHAQSVTGLDQQKSDYDTNEKAYASWIRVTKSHFNIPDGLAMNPLIVLDTCEVLGVTDCKHEVHKTTRPGTPYTLLELFCSAIPSPHKIFVIGCNARMQYVGMAATFANIDEMQPLQPLSESAHKDAVASWGKGVKDWKIDEAVCKPIYHWTAGSPRLLLAAHTLFSGTISLANGNADAVYTCFIQFQEYASSLYKMLPEWLPYAVSCLLVSSTKVKVKNPDNCIPINPDWKKFLGVSWGEGGTFREAAGWSMGTYVLKDQLFVVPPIIFSDDVMKSLMVEKYVNGKMEEVDDALIMPSQLHPYFSQEEVAAQLGRSSPTERGNLFEKPFVYAVYARYLLAYWEKPRSKWVPLTKVFDGAFQQQQEDIMKGYEVNLSGGVRMRLTKQLYSNAVPNALTYFGSSAHHD